MRNSLVLDLPQKAEWKINLSLASPPWGGSVADTRTQQFPSPRTHCSWQLVWLEEFSKLWLCLTSSIMHAWPPQHTTVQCKTVQLFLPSVKLSLPNFRCASQGLTQRRKSLHYLSSKFSPSSTGKRAWGNSSTTWGNKGKKKGKTLGK